MRIKLENTNVDPRIFDVTIDFTGYPKDSKFFPWMGVSLRWQVSTVSNDMLDELLKTVKLRRITYWKTDYSRGRGRTNVYQTTVISDRMNKRNDVGNG